MSIKFSKAILMSGKDFELTSLITLHHPTVKEILSINKSSFPDNVYWTYIQILLADPYSNMVMLDDMGRNYLEVSPYEVFVLQWDNCITDYEKNKEIYDAYGLNPLDNITKALSFFIKEEHCFKKETLKDGTVYFYDVNNPLCYINEEIFDYIYEWVKSVNKVDYSNRINPADNNARRVLIEDMKEKIKKAKKRNKKQEDNFDYLGNIMSAASFCSSGFITPFNINDCKIYWLNESLSINSRKNHAEHILDGLYHGTISSKNINKKELDWVN